MIEMILRQKGDSVATVRPEETIASAARLLALRRIGAVLVCDTEGSIVGVLSERDVVRGLAEHGPTMFERPISDLMTHAVVTCHPGHSVNEVMGLMTERRIRHVPVVEEGRLVGIVSIGDLVKHRIEEIEREAAELREYITMS